jgi:hypothetical protein
MESHKRLKWMPTKFPQGLLQPSWRWGHHQHVTHFCPISERHSDPVRLCNTNGLLMAEWIAISRVPRPDMLGELILPRKTIYLIGTRAASDWTPSADGRYMKDFLMAIEVLKSAEGSFCHAARPEADESTVTKRTGIRDMLLAMNRSVRFNPHRSSGLGDHLLPIWLGLGVEGCGLGAFGEGQVEEEGGG